MPRSRIYPGDGDPRHGTNNGYSNLKCHCDGCTRAAADWHYDYMHADPERLRRHADQQRVRDQARRES